MPGSKEGEDHVETNMLSSSFRGQRLLLRQKTPDLLALRLNNGALFTGCRKILWIVMNRKDVQQPFMAVTAVLFSLG